MPQASHVPNVADTYSAPGARATCWSANLELQLKGSTQEAVTQLIVSGVNDGAPNCTWGRHDRDAWADARRKVAPCDRRRRS